MYRVLYCSLVFMAMMKLDIARAHETLSESNFAIVIDAGSSGSRVSIFELKRPNKDTLEIAPAFGQSPLNKSVYKEKKAGGIHTAQLASLSHFLEPLAKFALEQLYNLNVSPKDVPIYFRGTAGLRSISSEKQQAILDGVTKYFKARGFENTTASVIDGVTEGVFAWITVNYLLGNLQNDDCKLNTQGVIEMGGASTQITFLPLETPAHHGVRLALGGTHYDLYSYSHEGLGQQKAFERLASQECLQNGVDKDQNLLDEVGSIQELINKDSFTTAGNFGECKNRITKALEERCVSHQDCGILDVYQPRVTGRFIAMGGFAQLSNLFNLSFDAVSLDEFGKKACATPWDDFKIEYQKKDLPKFLSTACFEAAYYSALLSGDTGAAGSRYDGYGFLPTSQSIESTLKIREQEISWALGVVLFEELGGKMSNQPSLTRATREEL